MPQNKILISSCLLGANVKYDGGNNSILNNPIIEELIAKNILIPFCPEVEGGLPIPRVPCEIIDNKVVNKNAEDKTYEFKLGAKKTLDLVKKEGIKIAIMKSKSPSCGNGKIYDGTFSKRLIEGNGVTAELLKRNGIKVFNELEIFEAYKEYKRAIK